MANIGYARVSTVDQTADLQLDALKEAGCERIFTDLGVSGSTVARPELAKALEYLRPGDVLVVWKLDRLGRSLTHLISAVQDLGERNVDLRSLREQIDTSTAAGKLVFHVFGAVAEFERDLISERTRAGLAAARARGRKGGRKPALSDDGIAAARAMRDNQDMTLVEIAATLKVSRATVVRALEKTARLSESAALSEGAERMEVEAGGNP